MQQLKDFFDACAPFGYPLLLCSIVLFAAIFYHITVQRSRRDLQRLQPLWLDTRQKRDGARDALVRQCHVMQSPLASEILFLAEHKDEPTEELSEQLESHLSLHLDAERAGMATISVITNIAPMLGILGTAWGLVDIFGVFGSPEATAGITLGISKALYTTIFGLAISVPGTIALTSFERAIERRSALITAFFSDILANRQRL